MLVPIHRLEHKLLLRRLVGALDFTLACLKRQPKAGKETRACDHKRPRPVRDDGPGKETLPPSDESLDHECRLFESSVATASFA